MAFEAGSKVRYSSDGRIGEITGKYRERGDAWQVCFDGVDLLWVPGEKLEPVHGREDVYDLFQSERFMGISDFRRRLYRYRMSGELTNLMYSMDNAVARFMPHQFIPVIKFLESYTDRLLIADEVGLGKTIEAMYIWEELLARKNAKRLLVVVPAVLRDKWKGDMKHFFGIEAQVVSAQGKSGDRTLLSSLLEARESPLRTSFALIVSLEGIRTAYDVRKVLEECQDVEQILDLTIIDEAHYLRNSETEGFKTGELLRDVSRHLVLLSATPIQTSSNNFFNLLSLLAPEDFTYRETFESQLMENRPLVLLANALERNEKAEIVADLVRDALDNEVFANDEDLNRLAGDVDGIVSNPRERVVMIDRIKGKYFYSGLVTRSRKRDVFEGRTQRNVVSVNFALNDYERAFYDEVSAHLRSEAEGKNNFSVFKLIARQRQMASCMPGALRAWRGIGCDDDFDEAVAAAEGKDAARLQAMPAFEHIDLERLEREDSKFGTVLAKVQEILAANPSEKIIIFSFFRNTVRYLHERLTEEGISATYIMGGISREEKMARIEDFENTSLNVLVSSEVGSEGIDLQFARYELNYDLPWNPMRLEQRIGRIDRIGQEADQIFICNAYCENTIEDRILSRLYQRIEVFRAVLGDLEEVMGEQIKNLEVNVFREGELTEEQINERAEQVINAVHCQQELTRALELEAANMSSAYQQYVLGNITNSYKAKRLLTADELLFFCKDVLQEKFQGSSVREVVAGVVADVKLSEDARRELLRYTINNPMSMGTQLSSVPAGLRCCFGKKLPEEASSLEIVECIDINHPLVRWLLHVVERDAIHTSGCEVMSISRSLLPEEVRLKPGFYAYAVQQWRANGIRNVNELRYYLASGIYGEEESTISLNGNEAETALVAVMLYGGRFDANLLSPDDFNACGMALQSIAERMEDDFADFSDDMSRRNRDLVEEQTKYIERTASLKAGKIEAMINKMEAEGKSPGVINMNRKRRDKVLESRDARVANMRDRLDCAVVCGDVVVGILEVKEG